MQSAQVEKIQQNVDSVVKIHNSIRINGNAMYNERRNVSITAQKALWNQRKRESFVFVAFC